MKLFNLKIFFFLVLIFSQYKVNSKFVLPIQNKSIKRIIIDPGHGGKDPGTKGKYSYEKDIALAVSLKLEQYLKTNLPDVEVILTRRTDIYDNVVEKAKIANQLKGDLFISIHVNSAPGPTQKEFIGYSTEIRYLGKGKNRKKKKVQVKKYRIIHLPSTAEGTETFIYNINKTEQKLKAANEIVDDYLEDIDSTSIKEIKKFEAHNNDPSKKILASLLTQQFFERSANLAITIEEEFKNAGRISREAQQRPKGIWVLQAVAMPAVLIETGFISNPKEEDYLNSEIGQNEIVESITKAVIRYKYSLEKIVHSNSTDTTKKDKGSNKYFIKSPKN